MTRPFARNRARLLAGCVTLLLALPTLGARADNSSLTAQGLTCDVTGEVVDQRGAAVEGARVTLLDAAEVELRHAGTDRQCRFAFARLTAASYVVSASKHGFRETRHVLRLTPGADLSVRMRLDVGELRESVTVTPLRGEAQDLFETPE